MHCILYRSPVRGVLHGQQVAVDVVAAVEGVVPCIVQHGGHPLLQRGEALGVGDGHRVRHGVVRYVAVHARHYLRRDIRGDGGGFAVECLDVLVGKRHEAASLHELVAVV